METQHLENKELETILGKLEKIDIREWDCDDNGFIIVEKYGLKFALGWCQLRIQNTDKSPLYWQRYDYEDAKKPLKKAFEGFYERIRGRLREQQKKELEERLKNFLSE